MIGSRAKNWCAPSFFLVVLLATPAFAQVTPCPISDGVISDFVISPVVDGESLSCNNSPANHAENHFWRTWNLNGQVGVDTIALTCIEIGVYTSVPAVGTTQPMAINVYLDEDGTSWPTVTSLTLIASYDFDLPSGLSSEIYPVVFPTPIDIPCSTINGANATLVIDVMCYDMNQGDFFAMGSMLPTTSAQLQPCYISAASCGLPNPVPLASLSAPELQWVIEPHYDITPAAPCFPAPGLVNFQCANIDGFTGIEVSWDAPTTLPDSYDIYVDGGIVGNIPGTSTSYLTPDQAPYLNHTVAVQEIVGGVPISDTNCSVNVSPANDTYVGAESIGAGSYPFVCDGNFNGTDSPAVDIGVCSFGAGVQQQFNDIFFCYTAAVTGSVLVSTCGATGDTMLSAYDNGCGSDDPATVIACNDDATSGLCGNAAEMVVEVVIGNDYLFRLGTFNPALSASGVLQVSECVGPQDLAANSDCQTGDVTLSWTAGNNWNSLEVYRDGSSIAILSGSATGYLDTGVDDGDHVYELVSSCGSATATSQVVTSVLVYSGQSDIVFALEGLQSFGDVGAIDSGVALTAALVNAGQDVGMVRVSPLDYDCVSDAGVVNIWVMTGTFLTDYRLNSTEGDLLGSLGAAGKNIYFEGGDHFGFFHVASAFDSRDGVDDATYDTGDGNDDFTAMDGLASSILDLSDMSDVVYNQDNPLDSDDNDHLTPATGDGAGPDAFGAWRFAASLAAGDAITTVVYDTNSGGKTIVSSWEFGGYTDDQIDLAMRYRAALTFGIEMGFKRGDSNADGDFNIADAVFLLTHLFNMGPEPACLDAADANDDGNKNIADAVFILGSLFQQGFPLPPLPGPFACGEDPTADTLDCLDYGNCP